MLNVLFRQIVISPFLGVKKGHVHSTHREKSSQKSLCNYYSLFKMPTIYPGPVCPSFLQLEDVFCFGGLYLDLLLRFRHNKQVSRAFREVGLLLIVFTWNESFELSCNCTNIDLHHLNWLYSLLYTSFYFNFHVTIEHQPCNKPNLYT